MVIETVLPTVRDQSQLLPARENTPEWQSHHENAQAVIRRAIDSVRTLDRALVVGVGTGADLPPEIKEFGNIYLNDSNPAMISTARDSLGTGAGTFHDVSGDILGFLPDVREYLATINNDLPEAEMEQGLRRLKRLRNPGLTAMPAADLTVSSMALPHIWEEPLLLLRSELQRKLGAVNAGKLIGILDEIDGELRYGLFLDYMRMLRQKTSQFGVIVLNTPLRKITAGGNQPVLPPRAGEYLARVSEKSRKRFGDEAVSEWIWEHDADTKYRVEGYLIDPVAMDSVAMD